MNIIQREIYEKLLKEAKLWCDPHAIGNIRQIKRYDKINSEFTNIMLWKAFKYVGKKKEERF